MKKSFLLLSLVFLFTACSYTSHPKIQSTASTAIPLTVGDFIAFPHVDVEVGSNGEPWLPLKEMAQAIDFKYDWNKEAGNFDIGYTDIVYHLRMDDRKAQAFNREKELPLAPKIINYQPYISLTSWKALTGREVSFDAQKHQLIMPAPTSEKTETQSIMSVQSTFNGTADELIRFASQFKGVPYLLGAAPYPQSHQFDCSSFTQHVYGQFGVNLPRGAQDQSRLGTTVTKDALQPGDLVFFLTPSTFGDHHVGHVGMYIGNNQIIHTYGTGGVKINDLNGYWGNVFLFGKRII